MKTLKNIAAIACVAALAAPAAVVAKGPTGEQHSNKAHQKTTTVKTHTNQRCKKTPRVGFTVRGTVVSYDATSKTLVLDVADNGVSKHAKKYITEDPLTVTGAKVGDPAPTAGDKVTVHGKIDKPKKKCPETDAAIKASVKYTRVTPQATTPEQPEQADQQKAANAA